MAPWFNLNFDSFERLANDASQSLLRLAGACGERTLSKEGLKGWAEDVGEGPVCLLVPIKGKKIMLLHDVSIQGDNLAGFSGFQLCAPLTFVELSSVAKPAIKPKLSAATKRVKLPSMEQLLQAGTVKALLGIKGESNRSIGDLQEEGMLSALTPDKLLPLKEITQAKGASELLLLLCKALEEPQESQDQAELNAQWEPVLQKLWATAKDAGNSCKLDNRAPLDEEGEEWFLQKTADLAEYAGGRKEDAGNGPSDVQHPAEGDDPMDEDIVGPSGETAVGNDGPSVEKGGEEHLHEENEVEEISISRVLERRASKSKKTKKRKSKKRSKRRRRYESTSEESSSESDSESNSSYSSDSSREERRRRRKRSSHRKEEEDLLRPETWTTKSRDRSCIAKWTESQQKLVRLLSAERGDLHRKGLPPLTEFLAGIVRHNKANNAQETVEEEITQNGWQADIFKPALIEFLRKGARWDKYEEKPGGLTVFMLAAFGTNDASEQQDRLERINEIFGDGKMSEASLRSLANFKHDLPKDLADTEARIVAFIGLLKLLFGERSIALQGYEEGLRLLRDRRRTFLREGIKDVTFFTRYLHLLDCIFQDFCRRLLRLHAENPRRPLERLRPNIMRDEVYSTYVGVFESYTESKLKLPSSLQVLERNQATPATTEIATRPEGGAQREEPWMRTNPNPVREWGLPEGKTYREVFGSPASKRGFPKIKHHSRPGRELVCVPYLVVGKCSNGRGCRKAHFKTADLSEETKTAISTRLQEVYSSQ